MRRTLSLRRWGTGLAAVFAASAAAGSAGAQAFQAPSPCGQMMTVGTNAQVSFGVLATGAPGVPLTLSAAGLPPGASQSPALPTTGSPVSSSFYWVPGLPQSGAYVFVYTATNPYGGQALCDLTIHVQPGCAGSSTTYGTACAGTGGLKPKLSLYGCPSPGQTVTIQVSLALGGALAVVFFSGLPAQFPLPNGCTAYLSPSTMLPVAFPLSLSGVGPGAGFVNAPVSLPPEMTAGDFAMQVLVLDGGAPSGYATTRAVSVAVR